MCTDELLSYNGLDVEYAHKVINHDCENYWALVKRAISGTYVAVEPFHLFRYPDKQSFRHNYRKGMDDFDRFKLAASQMVGKRS